MNKDEAVQKLAKVAHISMSYAEDLYDSFFEKPVVPQYVADWYEEKKDDFKVNIWARLIDWDRRKNHPLFNEWFDQTDNPIQTLINMHQFGYEVEVEKEPKYTVRIKGIDGYCKYLNLDTHTQKWLFASNERIEGFRTKHTRKELEANGFGWVFNCEGVEVKEVE